MAIGKKASEARDSAADDVEEMVNEIKEIAGIRGQ